MTDRLLKLFTILWILDTLFTTIFVSIAGIEAEANPVMQYAIQHLGLTGFVIVKMLVLAGFSAIMMYNPHRRTSNVIVAALNAIMFYVVIMGAMMVHLVTTTPL